jgi:hypothetical protein
MFKLLLIAAVFLAPLSALAGEISDIDIATYELAGKNNQPSNMQIRLSKTNGKWVMEGKQGSASWKNISCDSGCDYSASSSAEMAAYLSVFPDDMQKRFDIACIQNVANAFCRLTKKDDSSKGGYALVALVTGNPVPLSLKRLTKPYPSKK